MNKEAALMMEDNLSQVWNERDPEDRLKAIEKIYDPAANLYHVGDHENGILYSNATLADGSFYPMKGTIKPIK